MKKYKYKKIVFILTILLLPALILGSRYNVGYVTTTNGKQVKDIDTSVRLEDGFMISGTDKLIYKGKSIEEYSFTGAKWGISRDELEKSFEEIGYQKVDNESLNSLKYIIGMLADGWDSNFEFNVNDELFRIDMNPMHQYADETAFNTLVKMAFKGLHDRYGDYKVTWDYVTYVDNPTWEDTWETFLEEGEISILFEKNEIRSMLVMTLDVMDDVNVYDIYLGMANMKYSSLQQVEVIDEGIESIEE